MVEFFPNHAGAILDLFQHVNVMWQSKIKCLEAFPVDNGWTTFIIFLFGDPHLLEGRE